VDAFSMVFGNQAEGQDRGILLAAVALVVLYVVLLRLVPRGRRVVLNLAFVPLFFVGMEAATRCFGPPSHPLLQPHPTRVWMLRPNLDYRDGEKRIISNAQGYRNTQAFAPEPSPGVLRILCLGDSWMYGFGVDQDASIPARLQALLEEKRGRGKVEVINGGVFGYGPSQGVSTLQEGLRLRPRIVLVGLFHNMNAQLSTLRNTASGARSVLQMSNFYLWLRLKLRPAIRQMRGGAQDDRMFHASIREDYEAMVREARAAGATCVFVDYLAPPPQWPEQKVRYEDLSEETRNHEMLQVARESGCTVVPATYFLEDGGDRYADVVHDKAHPNAAGCAWIAQRVARAIEQLKVP